MCPYCEIKNFQKIIIFTIQPCAPYSKGEQKKRHVNGPDDVTSTDRGRNSYALHREPSETLTHLCKKSICTIFAKCKQFCAKRNYKGTKSTDRQTGGRVQCPLFVSRPARDNHHDRRSQKHGYRCRGGLSRSKKVSPVTRPQVCRAEPSSAINSAKGRTPKLTRAWHKTKPGGTVRTMDAQTC